MSDRNITTDPGTPRFVIEDGRGCMLWKDGLRQPALAFEYVREIERLGSQLGAARELLEQWMLASDDFDMNDWVLSVRNMLEDSNPLNSTHDDVPTVHMGLDDQPHDGKRADCAKCNAVDVAGES